MSSFADFPISQRTPTFLLVALRRLWYDVAVRRLYLREASMRIRTPVDLGAFIRDRRIKLGFEQRELAEKAGVSRQWIVEVEKGKPRAEIGLLLRTINALGILLATEED